MTYPDEWPEDASAEWVRLPDTIAAVLGQIEYADRLTFDADTMTLTLYRDTPEAVTE